MENEKDFIVIGVGAGGSRIAEAIGSRARISSCAVNTADVDLRGTQTTHQIKIGKTDGAGKTLSVGLAAMQGSASRITTFIRETYPQVRVIILCATLGGGTGSGGINYLAQALRSMGKVTPIVAVIPTKSRSTDEQINTLRTLDEIVKNFPVYLFDNETLLTSQGQRTLEEMYRYGNSRIAAFWRDFIVLSRESTQEALDREDLMRIIKVKGISTFGRIDIHAALQSGFRPEQIIQDSLFSDANPMTSTFAGGLLKIGASADIREDITSDFQERLITKIRTYGTNITIGKYTAGEYQTEMILMFTGMDKPKRITDLLTRTIPEAQKLKDKMNRQVSVLTPDQKKLLQF